MKKNSLTLLINNKPYSLSEDGGSRHKEVQLVGRITESAFYDVFAEHMRLISNAKRVELKVTGQQCNKTIKFSDANIREFKKFYETQLLSTIVKKVNLPSD